jgi:phosphoribosylformylglycinamidine (FGAM) synthase PurS component
MNAIEMYVKSIIPDTTAITALHTMERMGFRLKKLQRLDYYKFYFTGDIEKFKNEISKVDILINANKHRFSFSINENGQKILVKEIDDGAKSTLLTLKKRLGFTNIEKLEKGTLWILDFNEDVKNSKEMAKIIAEKLLYNKHYQELGIL